MVNTEIALAQDLSLGHRARFHAAVDTGVFIAHHNAFPTPMGASARHVDITFQRNDRGDRVLAVNCVQDLFGLFDDYRLARQ